jgi:hypothetical protein
MTNARYIISINDLFTRHGLQPSALVNDAELHLYQMQVEALVASGDLFVTLATELDNISETLARMDSSHIRLELEKLTRILLYLQQHHKVIPKT